MRQAKPDDVFHFVTPTRIAADWGEIVRYLGQERPSWTWLRDAPEQDLGFSPLTFSWCLRGLRVGLLASRYGASEDEARSLEVYRDELLARVVAMVQPEGPPP